MRRFIIVLLLIVPAAALQAQRIQIDLPASLAAKAVETVDVTLDGPLLRLAAKFLDADDKDQRIAREMIGKLEGIYVKSYQFDEEGAYDQAVLDKVRAQLGPGWKRLVMVKERHEATEIHANMRGDNVVGLLVISAEPRELTVVNLVGPVDLDRLTSLEGHFGIPHVHRNSGKERDNE